MQSRIWWLAAISRDRLINAFSSARRLTQTGEFATNFVGGKTHEREREESGVRAFEHGKERKKWVAHTHAQI